MIGARTKRIEDPPLLRGRGMFVDDIHLPGMLHAAFVRSPHPHALVHSVESSAARALPGVRAVYSLADFAPHVVDRRLPLQFPTGNLPGDVTPWLLAGDEVCHVGEAVAMVVADSRYEAEDAAPLVGIEYEPLPSVAGSAAAAADGAPPVHSGRSGNVLDRITETWIRPSPTPITCFGSVSCSTAGAPTRSRVGAPWRATTGRTIA